MKLIQRRFPSFLIALSATLVMHGVLLLTLHGMKINPKMHQAGLVEHHGKSQLPDRDPLTLEECQKRSQALAELLNRCPLPLTNRLPLDPAALDHELIAAGDSPVALDYVDNNAVDISLSGSDWLAPELPPANLLASGWSPATHRLAGDVIIENLDQQLLDEGVPLGDVQNVDEGLFSLNEQDGALADQLLALLPSHRDQIRDTLNLDDSAPPFQSEAVSQLIPFLNRPDTAAEESPQLARIASSQDFDLEVTLMPCGEEDGYFFQLILLPKQEALFKRIRQNYYFLIDRSHSIPKERYQAFKDSVAIGLDLLHPGDRFNILVFDDRVARFSEEPVCWSPQNIERAKSFLKLEQHGGIFACTELYASLKRILPENVAQAEMSTAILLSDGDTFLKLPEQRKAIRQWTGQNKGRVTLFSLAAGSGNNLALLDLLSRLNKGKALYTNSSQDLSYVLERLIKAIRNPIGKDLVATVIPTDPSARFRLYPRPQRMPQLYEHWPFTICGTVDRLCDFHLFVQGAHYDRWLDLSHLVSLKTAKRNSGLLNEMSKLSVHDCYDRFISDGNASHLTTATRILQQMETR